MKTGIPFAHNLTGKTSLQGSCSHWRESVFKQVVPWTPPVLPCTGLQCMIWYFTVATIHCGCQKIRLVFRVLEMYDFKKQFNCIYHATKVDLSLLPQLHKKLFSAGSAGMNLPKFNLNSRKVWTKQGPKWSTTMGFSAMFTF